MPGVKISTPSSSSSSMIAFDTPDAVRANARVQEAYLGSVLAEQQAAAALRDHVIVVGYGLNGRNLARVLRGANIPLPFSTKTLVCKPLSSTASASSAKSSSVRVR